MGSQLTLPRSSPYAEDYSRWRMPALRDAYERWRSLQSARAAKREVPDPAADLKLNRREFFEIFTAPTTAHFVSLPLDHFKLYMSADDQQVEARRVLLAICLFSEGSIDPKTQFIFHLFDRGDKGRLDINDFRELIASLTRLLHKLKVKHREPTGREDVDYLANGACNEADVVKRGVVSLYDFQGWVRLRLDLGGVAAFFKSAKNREVTDGEKRAKRKADAKAAAAGVATGQAKPRGGGAPGSPLRHGGGAGAGAGHAGDHGHDGGSSGPSRASTASDPVGFADTAAGLIASQRHGAKQKALAAAKALRSSGARATGGANVATNYHGSGAGGRGGMEMLAGIGEDDDGDELGSMPAPRMHAAGHVMTGKSFGPAGGARLAAQDSMDGYGRGAFAPGGGDSLPAYNHPQRQFGAGAGGISAMDSVDAIFGMGRRSGTNPALGAGNSRALFGAASIGDLQHSNRVDPVHHGADRFQGYASYAEQVANHQAEAVRKANAARIAARKRAGSEAHDPYERNELDLAYEDDQMDISSRLEAAALQAKQSETRSNKVKSIASDTILRTLVKDSRFNTHELTILANGFAEYSDVTAHLDFNAFNNMLMRHVPKLADVHGGRFFEVADTTGDGRITFREFIVVMSVVVRGTMAEKLEAVFNLIDEAGEGYITAVAFVQFLRAVSDNPALRRMVDTTESLMMVMDENADGEITREEFLAALTSNAAANATFARCVAVSSRMATAINTLRGACRGFTYTNLNRGWSPSFRQRLKESLTKEKWRRFCAERFGVRATDHELLEIVDEIFMSFDVRGRGSVGFRSVLNGCAQVLADKPTQRIEYWFDLYDADGNGTLDPNEVLYMILSSQEVHRDAVLLVGRLQHLDPDADGIIEFDDFMKGCIDDGLITKAVEGLFRVTGTVAEMFGRLTKTGHADMRTSELVAAASWRHVAHVAHAAITAKASDRMKNRLKALAARARERGLDQRKKKKMELNRLLREAEEEYKYVDADAEKGLAGVGSFRADVHESGKVLKPPSALDKALGFDAVDTAVDQGRPPLLGAAGTRQGSSKWNLKALQRGSSKKLDVEATASRGKAPLGRARSDGALGNVAAGAAAAAAAAGGGGSVASTVAQARAQVAAHGGVQARRLHKHTQSAHALPTSGRSTASIGTLAARGSFVSHRRLGGLAVTRAKRGTAVAQANISVALGAAGTAPGPGRVTATGGAPTTVPLVQSAHARQLELRMKEARVSALQRARDVRSGSTPDSARVRGDAQTDAANAEIARQKKKRERERRRRTGARGWDHHDAPEHADGDSAFDAEMIREKTRRSRAASTAGGSASGGGGSATGQAPQSKFRWRADGVMEDW